MSLDTSFGIALNQGQPTSSGASQAWIAAVVIVVLLVVAVAVWLLVRYRKRMSFQSKKPKLAQQDSQAEQNWTRNPVADISTNHGSVALTDVSTK